ncbi:MAG: hypothetical protein ABJB65_09000, partial [Chloroflexota bacterium]
MPTSQLIRWSGLSLMLGAIGTAVELLLHPAGETAQYVLEPVWGFAHWLGAFSWLLILFGLIGLYARVGEGIGRLGFVGFVMAVVGAALTAGTLMIGGGVLQPVIAAGAPHLLDLDGPFFTSWGFKLGGALIGAGFVGLLLLAIALLRARALSSLGSWLLILLVPTAIVGVPLVLFLAPGLQKIGQALLGVWVGAGLLAWGYA